MGYMDSSTSTITSLLTTKGREILARNDGTFRITKFKLGDDEINYGLYNIGNIDSEDADILAIPILEPSTNPDAALRFPLITLPEGTKRVAELTLSPQNVIVNLSTITNKFVTNINTLYNQDAYYIVSFNNVNTQFVNSLSLSQYSNEYLVNNQASETAYEWTVRALSNIQFSEAKFNTIVTLKKTREFTTSIDTANSNAASDSVNAAIVGGNSKSSILLFTMIVLGSQSGAFTTLDVYGQSGGTIINPPVITPLEIDSLQKSSNNTILGGNS